MATSRSSVLGDDGRWRIAGLVGGNYDYAIRRSAFHATVNNLVYGSILVPRRMLYRDISLDATARGCSLLVANQDVAEANF